MLFFFFNYSFGTSGIFSLFITVRLLITREVSLKKREKKKTKQFDQFYCNKSKESSDRRASKLHDSNLVKICVNLKQPDKALNLNGLVGRHC